MVTVLSEQEITLSEHHIYGSSRLGYKKYMPKQVYAYWNKEDSLSNYDTLSLISHRPWYSTEYQDVINGGALAPYGQTDRTTYAVQNIIGQKQYEFTNHLGNVLATTSDLPYRTGDHVSTGSYSAALKSAYDYYPFGSLKPGRFLSDTTSRCVTYTQSKWVVKTKDSTYWHPYSATVLNWVLGPIPLTSTPRQIVNVVNQDSIGYLIEVTDTATVGSNMELRQELEVSANETQTIVVSAEVLQGAFVLQAVEEVNGNERLLASTNLLPGGSGDDGASVAQNFTLTITPQTSTVSLRLSAPQNLGNVGTNVTALGSTLVTTRPTNVILWQKIRVKVNYLAQEQFTVTLCDSIDDKYRFGFNGKEKDNEFSGIGNYLDYGFRMYDSRLGRFNSPDPLIISKRKYPELSSYQFASNTPIQAIDLDGLEAFFIHGTTSNNKRWVAKDGSLKEGTRQLHRLQPSNYVNTGFEWGGFLNYGNNYFNDVDDRKKAASKLLKYIMANRIKGEDITLIGHSHGGNVAILVAPLLRVELDKINAKDVKINIITVATPAVNSHKSPENPVSAEKSINKHIHIYNIQDAVQRDLANAADGEDYDYSYSNDKTQNIKIDVSNEYKGRTTDAHAVDHDKPEVIKKNIDNGTIPKI